jgi:hypothetical protein
MVVYLKWILLAVCVGLTVWPLLIGYEDRGGKEGNKS